MSDIKAVLFDFDGVLCDTGLMHTNALADAIRHALGTEDAICNMLENKLEAFGTIPSREKLRFLGIPEMYHGRIYARKQEIVLSREVPTALDSVLDTLRYCVRCHFSMGIVSNTNYAVISRWLHKNQLVTKVGRFFPIITNDWSLKSKPDPEPYTTACDLLGLATYQVVAVEDSPNGCAAALRAGCKLFHVENSSQLSERGIQQWV